MSYYLATASIFVLVVLSLWSLTNRRDSGYTLNLVAKEETEDWGYEVWPIGVLLLAIYFARTKLYNPNAIAVLVLTLLGFAAAQTITEGREVVQALFVLGSIAVAAQLAPQSPLLKYAIPLIFALAAASFALFYFGKLIYMRLLLGVGVVVAAAVACPPRNFADSAALLIATGLFVR